MHKSKIDGSPSAPYEISVASLDDYLFALLSPSSFCAVMMATRSNMLAAGISNNKVKYARLAADDDGYIDLQVRDFVG